MPLRGGACGVRIPSDHGGYKAVRGSGRRGGRNRQRQRQRRRDWRGAGARCRRGWSGGRNVAAMSEKIDELQELFMSKRGQQIQYTIGRIMLTFTFLDDALRVFKEWGSQVDYMGGQLGPLKPIAPALLLVFIIAQVSGSAPGRSRFSTSRNRKGGLPRRSRKGTRMRPASTLRRFSQQPGRISSSGTRGPRTTRWQRT